MIAPELLNKLQRLNREEMLEVIQFLREETSNDVNKFFRGKRVVRVPTLFVASDGGAAMKRVLEEDQAQNG